MLSSYLRLVPEEHKIPDTLKVLANWIKRVGNLKDGIINIVRKQVGLHRILILPDIRLNSNIELFFRENCTFI